MIIEQIAKYLVLAITYLGLALGQIPGFRMNRATIAFTGSAFLILLGVINLQEAWEAIDPGTIFFLLSMMIVNGFLTYSGFFGFTLYLLVRLAKSPFGLLIILTFGTGLLSALFINDTMALVFTPLTLHVTSTLRLNPIPYLLALAAATNIGSVATINGNPQNILIGSFSGIGYLEFARFLMPISAIGLVIQIIFLWLIYPEVRSWKSVTQIPEIKYKIIKPLFIKTLVITVGLLTAFVFGYPLGEASLVAAALLLITRRIKPQRILQYIDWSLLVMFSGLFILTQAVQKLNLLPFFSHLTDTSWGLLSSVVILSNLISNVPAVLLLQPLIERTDTHSWLLLAAGSTLAGNLTLFGAVANLITSEAAAQLGYKLTFWEHLRLGMPLTVTTAIISYFWLS